MLEPSANFFGRAIATAVLAALLTAGVSISYRKGSQAAMSGPSNASSQPVLVELFTSEGCSSCPPADALLKGLSEKQPIPGVQIIALEEHVDYWNHLGWADPFSSRDFTERQNDYARGFGTDNVYTPQMIVDGQFELVGSRSEEARRTIQKAAKQPKLDVAVRWSANSTPGKPALEIEVANSSGIPLHDSVEIWVALAETNLQSDVKAGENSGEVLKHASVVRSLRKIETRKDAAGYRKEVALTVDSRWNRENLSAVAIVAEKTSHKVVGAGTIALHP